RKRNAERGTPPYQFHVDLVAGVMGIYKTSYGAKPFLYLGYVDETPVATYIFPHEDFNDCPVSGPIDERLLITTNAFRMGEDTCQTYRSRVQAERPESFLNCDRRFQRGWGSGQSSSASQPAHSEAWFLYLSDDGDGL